MATSVLPTVATPVSTSSSAAPASTSASFTWLPIGEMFTCGQTNVRWAFTGNSSPLTLNITNINVTQQAPLSTSSTGPSSTSQASTSAAAVSITNLSRVKRQFNGFGGSYLPSVNEIIIAGIDPASNNFTWTSVNVPQGWYQIYANVQNAVQVTSSSFFVLNGTNTNCVPQYAVTTPSTRANSSSTSPVPVATSSSSVLVQSGHSHAGAIAGGVVGGLAFMAAVFAAIFFCFLRRRPSRSRIRDDDGGGRRWSELSFRKFRSGKNTRSSMQKTSPNLQAEQTVIGSEEEVSTVEHEKAIAAAQALSHPSQQPTRSQSLRTSTQTTTSYRDGRVTTNPERPPSRASYGANPGEVIPMEHTHLQHSPSITAPRRKPAPRYDGATEVGGRDGHSSSQTTLDPILGGSPSGSPDSVHILQHKSSFGAVRPMHVMVSDPPASVSP